MAVGDINKATLGITVFLLLILVFDGIRILGKIPGGTIPYREYDIKKADGTKEMGLTAFLGHRTITFEVDNEHQFNIGLQSDGTTKRLGGAVADITVDLTDKLVQIENSFLDNGNNTDVFSMTGDSCVDQAENIYNIEWTMFAITCVPIVVILLVLMGLLSSDAGSYRAEKRTITSIVYKTVGVLFLVYVALKITRFGLERRAFNPVDECVHHAFETRGINLIDNYLNLDKLTSEHKANLSVAGSTPNYNAMVHFMWLDIVHVALVVIFGVFGIFNENLQMLNPMGGLFETAMGSTMMSMETAMQSTALDNLLTT